MQLTLAEYRRRFPDRPDPVPLEYAGQWVAWNEQRTQIVAHDKDLSSAHNEAIALGCSNPIMQRVIGTVFIGSL
jgi:hypothetical protein